MSVKVMYQPPDPDDPPPPGHRCDLPSPQIVTVDTVIQCKECGLRWICRHRSDNVGWTGNVWVRLRIVHRPWWTLRYR